MDTSKPIMFKDIIEMYKTAQSSQPSGEGGFLVHPDLLYGYWRRRGTVIRLWRKLRRQPLDDWMPGILELAAMAEDNNGHE